jgi:hypothetical protein
MALITSLKGSEGADKETKAPSRTIDDGPPPSATKPRKVDAAGSLFAQSGRGLMDANSAGLGPEGSDPQILGMQSMGRLMMEIKTLSALFPGITPILSDLVGRLQMVVPQLAQDVSNGGMGLVPLGGMPLPQPMGGGAPMGGPPGMGGMPPSPINPQAGGMPAGPPLLPPMR